MARPKDSDSAEVQAAILKAAAELLREDDRSGLSLRRVAKRAGFSIGTLTYYYDTKEALVGALFAQLFAEFFELRDAVTESLRGGEDPRAVMEMAVRRGFRLAVTWRGPLRLSQLMVLEKGMPASQQRFEDDVLLDAGTRFAEVAFGTSIPDARLLLKSILFCTVRYATLADDELLRVVGLDEGTDIAVAHELVEDHLARLLLTAMASHPS